jgi:starch-binding outer membrane protein, SusD/RagB family
MKTLHKYLFSLFLLSLLFLSGCSEYLEKTEKADVTAEAVFTNFINYQGFVESMYAAIVFPYKAFSTGIVDPNMGDDLFVSYGATNTVHNGDYIGLLRSGDSYLYNNSNHDPLNWGIVQHGYTHTVWAGWKAIRVANIALHNIDMLQGATQEEANLLMGQSYFFRGYFHWEIMRAWGAIPYVNVFFYPDSDMRIPVLNFHETAELVLEDLDMAIDLLPMDWDLTEAGKRTEQNNHGRLTKGMALAMKAEVLLYCGSPMINGTVTGNYIYHEEYCKRASSAAWEVLKLVDQGIYKLEPYETIGEVFYSPNSGIAGKDEKIFSGIQRWSDRWNSALSMVFNINQGGNNTASVCAQYVENYGMANGLPIHDPASGYNPSAPFANRDPRFYKDLRIDRDRICQSLPLNHVNATAQLFIGGRDRRSMDSMTGYGYKKFVHPLFNTQDNWCGGTHRMWKNEHRLRLAEIYLFFAEAANEAYGPNIVPPGTSITAVDAVNIIRNRSNVPDVDAKYTSNKEDFRARVWNERAVELAFEVKRWYDIRRWYVAHLPEYKTHYALDFDKDWTYFEKRPQRQRIFNLKHYWLAFPTDQVNIYKGWPQNPGW